MRDEGLWWDPVLGPERLVDDSSIGKKWEGSGVVVDGERARRTVCICGISEWRCRQSRPKFRGEVHERDTPCGRQHVDGS